MESILLYVIAALSVVLLIVVIVLITQITNLKKEVWENAQQNANSTQALQSNLQSSIAQTVNQTVTEGYTQMYNVVSQGYTQMNQAVSQSYNHMNQAFDTKLSNSFNSINEGLNQLHKNVGEITSMASGVEDLKKVLSNVKTRGILGEIQLGGILEQIMPPSQYETNVETVPGTGKRVEFAVKLPGQGEDPVYLPIDSKFPGDAYAHLVDAAAAADENAVLAARKILIQQFKNEANDISTKYIQTPYTTDFAVMFLPVEGLYAEAVNLGMIEFLQRNYNVIIAGPSSMAALLNSLQMGFKTLAIQKNATQVWKVLGDVKGEFDNFALVLEKVQKNLNSTSAELDKLIGTRTRAIQRKLKAVQSLEDPDAEEGFYLEE